MSSEGIALVDARLARPMTGRDVALACRLLGELMRAAATTSEGELALCIALAAARMRSLANGKPDPLARYIEMVEAACRSGELEFAGPGVMLRRVEEYVMTQREQANDFPPP